MTTARNLIGSGNPGLTVQSVLGYLSNTLTAAGSTQGTALPITTDFAVCTTVASGTGVILPANAVASDQYMIANHGSNALLVYPPTGGAIANGTVNAGLSVPATKSVILKAITPLLWCANLSA